MQTITTQDECERVGLLALRAALERTGWEWRMEVHERMVFVTLTSPRSPSEARRVGRLDIGRLVMTFIDADHFDELVCSAHDGGGETGEYPNMHYRFLRYPG